MLRHFEIQKLSSTEKQKQKQKKQTGNGKKKLLLPVGTETAFLHRNMLDEKNVWVGSQTQSVVNSEGLQGIYTQVDISTHTPTWFVWRYGSTFHL